MSCQSVHTTTSVPANTDLRASFIQSAVLSTIPSLLLTFVCKVKLMLIVLKCFGVKDFNLSGYKEKENMSYLYFNILSLYTQLLAA